MISLFKKKSTKYSISVSGMKCPRCSAKVEKALSALGASDISISLDTGIVSCSVKESVSTSKLKDTIDALGFSVISIEAV